MKPVDQVVFEDGKGDCLRACVASIIEWSIESVPNWAEDGSYLGGAIPWLEARAASSRSGLTGTIAGKRICISLALMFTACSAELVRAILGISVSSTTSA